MFNFYYKHPIKSQKTIENTVIFVESCIFATLKRVHKITFISYKAKV